MEKLIVLLGIMLNLIITNAQTRQEFLTAIKEWDATIWQDTTVYIGLETTGNDITVKKEKSDGIITVFAIFEKDKMINWTESWLGATKADITLYLDKHSSLTKFDSYNIWIGSFMDRRFIVIPCFNWNSQNWFAQFTFM